MTSIDSTESYELRQGLTREQNALLDRLDQIEARAPGFTHWLNQIAAKRLDQINRFGHDGDHDQMQPIDAMPTMAKTFVHTARDHIRGLNQPQNLGLARAKLVTAAAVIIAALCRLDFAKPETRA